MTGYELSRTWFDFCFANPEKITPLHTAIYLFAVEHCNRLGWKSKFGLPTEMVKEAIGVKSWHTYIRAFNDLCDWNFFIIIERSKNQYSSNIIALSKIDEAHDEALDKAIAKHISKHVSKHLQSNDSIIKLITSNIELLTKNKDSFENFINETMKKQSATFIDFERTKEILNSEGEKGWRETMMMLSTVKSEYKILIKINEFLLLQSAAGYFPHEIGDTKRYFGNWIRSQKQELSNTIANDVLESKMVRY